MTTCFHLVHVRSQHNQEKERKKPELHHSIPRSRSAAFTTFNNFTWDLCLFFLWPVVYDDGVSSVLAVWPTVDNVYQANLGRRWEFESKCTWRARILSCGLHQSRCWLDTLLSACRSLFKFLTEYCLLIWHFKICILFCCSSCCCAQIYTGGTRQVSGWLETCSYKLFFGIQTILQRPCDTVKIETREKKSIGHKLLQLSNWCKACDAGDSVIGGEEM